jgi:uncharacterized membrane protein YbhN (UPF0104 family)
VLGQILLLAGLVFVVLRVRSLWHGSHIELARVDWPSIAGAFVLAGAAVIATGFIWLVILERLGAHTRPRWTAIFFQAQLAKYIPGTLWQYAGRITLARARGLPTRLVARSMPIELGASLAGAGITSLFLLGVWGIPIAGAVAAGCFIVAIRTRGATTQLRRDISTCTLATPIYAVVWVAVGSTFWLIASAFLAISLGQLPFYTGAFAAAWVVGVIAVYAPGGLGVREGVLVGLLNSRLGSADALVIAAASRVLLTLIDVAIAGVAFVILRRGRRTDAGPEKLGVSLDPPKSLTP